VIQAYDHNKFSQSFLFFLVVKCKHLRRGVDGLLIFLKPCSELGKFGSREALNCIFNFCNGAHAERVSHASQPNKQPLPDNHAWVVVSPQSFRERVLIQVADSQPATHKARLPGSGIAVGEKAISSKPTKKA
jgi:hypothetical protein